MALIPIRVTNRDDLLAWIAEQSAFTRPLKYHVDHVSNQDGDIQVFINSVEYLEESCESAKRLLDQWGNDEPLG